MNLYFFQHRSQPNEFFLLQIKELQSQTLEKIAQVLNACLLNPQALQRHTLQHSAQHYVCARVGTVSSWSSKACDILDQALQLEELEESSIRIERAYAVANPQAHDPLLESVFESLQHCAQVFVVIHSPNSQRFNHSFKSLQHANQALSLALSEEELRYLSAHFASIDHQPSDAELVMFAQANSEHCRHKIFNARYFVDKVPQNASLFDYIRLTHRHQPRGTLLAYSDNAAIIGTQNVDRFQASSSSAFENQHAPQYIYTYTPQQLHYVFKAETHNHPCAVSPHPGAATGAGGEIRDEGATGRGALPIAGLTAYSLSHLHIPSLVQAHEQTFLADCIPKAPHLATSLDILLQAPLGASSFNNEFGRPNLGGSLRVFQMQIPHASNQREKKQHAFGFHKPIMLAAGWGLIAHSNIRKQTLEAGNLLIQIGGPGYLIGLGGGAASSRSLTSQNQAFDFASVQRANAEMQRRAQMVIQFAAALGDHNPIKSIHDVGAGGLANALPEIVAADGLGAIIDLPSIPLGAQGLSAMEILSNESQERYVLALDTQHWQRFEQICQRERCPVAVLGEVTSAKQFIVRMDGADIINWSMPALLGRLPALTRHIEPYQTTAFALTHAPDQTQSPFDKQQFSQVLLDVLAHPSVASKRYLVHISDRSVGGLVFRDSLVGPWQVPVADAVITLTSHNALSGVAASQGERSPLAIFDAPASVRVAIAEALLNIWSAPVDRINDVKLSCNWMANAANTHQDAALYAAVSSASDFCQALQLSIPVGKDSLSMQAHWVENSKLAPTSNHPTQETSWSVQSPVALTVTALAPISNVSASLTPQLKTCPQTCLLWISPLPVKGLGASIAHQVAPQSIKPSLGADIDARSLQSMLQLLDTLKNKHMVLAYHDVSDGGVWACLLEMAFTSRLGLNIHVATEHFEQAIETLCIETPSFVIQISEDKLDAIKTAALSFNLRCELIATPRIGEQTQIHITYQNQTLAQFTLKALLQTWDRVAYALCKLRDNPTLALEEHESVQDDAPLLWEHHLEAYAHKLPKEAAVSAVPVLTKKLKVAILREQGVNSQHEMAWAWQQAGFQAIDVHMSDLQNGYHQLDQFHVLAACGGFSYGDVLGAGSGWAKSILLNEKLAVMFQRFFAHPDRLTLGVCNGCQMLSQLGTLIPHQPLLPQFLSNTSTRFEGRLSMVAISSPLNCFWFENLDALQLPIVVSHAQGKVHWDNNTQASHSNQAIPVLRFLQTPTQTAQRYPSNPNGSANGHTGFITANHRILMMMPHPERSLRYAQLSWQANASPLDQATPWQHLFHNALRYFK